MNKIVLTIGNFDGVHRGHQLLISRVLAQKALVKTEKLTATLMTFDPHPSQILIPGKNFRSILSLEDRVATIKKFGIENVIVVPFSRDLSELSPEEFFKKIIIGQFKTVALVVGYDFSFGKNRSGTKEILSKLCKENGVILEVVEPLKINGEVISSSKIRDALRDGDVEKAALFLGRTYEITGMVEKGLGRGRTIGFPTANLFTQAETIPKKGVYVTLAESGGKTWQSVTNIGDNPTFKDQYKTSTKIETYILDFENDIYGEKIKVHFVRRLRDEKKFSSVQELIAQIAQDVAEARNDGKKD